MSQDILSELQLLTSMYDPSDCHFDDPEVILKIDNSIPISGSVSLTLKLNDFLELNLRIPTGYPTETISAHCCLKTVKNNRNHLLIETEVSNMNHELMLFTKHGLNEKSASDILGIINWCNNYWETISTDLKLSLDDNAQDTAETTSSSSKEVTLCRIWIHSHHIYNEKKRKFLVETASKLDLSGFSLPGKPGFVCVEGDSKNCDDFWSQVRQLTWQKISLIDRQILNSSDDKAFHDSFEELLIDKSTFMKYLEDKKISNVIKDYLGF